MTIPLNISFDDLIKYIISIAGDVSHLSIGEPHCINYSLSKEQILQLASALKHSGITSLDLSWTFPSAHKQLLWLLEALKESNISTLNLSHNYIKESENLTSILEALDGSSVISLDLSSNYFSAPSRPIKLAEALKKLQYLGIQSLNLANNGLFLVPVNTYDAVITNVATLLQALAQSNVTSLNLSHNFFSAYFTNFTDWNKSKITSLSIDLDDLNCIYNRFNPAESVSPFAHTPITTLLLNSIDKYDKGLNLNHILSTVLEGSEITSLGLSTLPKHLCLEELPSSIKHLIIEKSELSNLKSWINSLPNSIKEISIGDVHLKNKTLQLVKLLIPLNTVIENEIKRLTKSDNGYLVKMGIFKTAKPKIDALNKIKQFLDTTDITKLDINVKASYDGLLNAINSFQETNLKSIFFSHRNRLSVFHAADKTPTSSNAYEKIKSQFDVLESLLRNPNEHQTSTKSARRSTS